MVNIYPILYLAAVNIFVMILKCIDILDKTIRRLLLPSFLTCRHLSTCSLAAFPIQLSCECLCNLKWSCLWERIHSIAKWRSVKKYSIFYELKSLCRDDSIPPSHVVELYDKYLPYPAPHYQIFYTGVHQSGQQREGDSRSTKHRYQYRILIKIRNYE